MQTKIMFPFIVRSHGMYRKSSIGKVITFGTQHLWMFKFIIVQAFKTFAKYVTTYLTRRNCHFMFSYFVVSVK